MQENSDLDLEHTAQITAQDMAVAQEFWRSWGSPLLEALLDAQAEPGELVKVRFAAPDLAPPTAQ